MRFLGLVVCLAALSISTGCARSRSLIVLLPDADGQVGTLKVSTTQGTLAVDQPYYAVAAGPDKGPEPPRKMDTGAFHAKFKRALASEPRQRFRFKTYTFFCRWNSPDLVPRSQEDLARTLRRLTTLGLAEIYVVGHADRMGTERHNLRLSMDRAQAMRQALVANGINSKIILISGLGESTPRIDTPDEIEEPGNRRVELVLKYIRPE